MPRKHRSKRLLRRTPLEYIRTISLPQQGALGKALPTHHSALRRSAVRPAGGIPLHLPDGGHVYFDSSDAAVFRNLRVHRRRHDRDYISVTIRGKNYYVHRLIMNAKPHEQVHHRDGNPLNCCRNNLVITTRAVNAGIRRKPRTARTSAYMGVSRPNGTAKYLVQIQINGKKYCLGYFENEVDAALAYDEYALRFRGELALLNFPEGVGLTTDLVDVPTNDA